jgi:methyl-accepting chemotaxis protein
VFDADGRLFATYLRDGHDEASVPATPSAPGTRFAADSLVVVHPIVLDGERVGTVYLRSGLSELTSRMLILVSVMGSIVGVSTLIALFIAALLQRWISGPILDLAQTARRVTVERNFTLRATRAGGDEVGPSSRTSTGCSARSSGRTTSCASAGSGWRRTWPRARRSSSRPTSS